MADTIITVPTNASQILKRSWMPNLDTILAAGNNVVFQDENGAEYPIPFVGFFGGNDGTIVIQLPDGSQRTMTFAAGGWHQQWVSRIIASGSTTNGSLMAKLV